MTYTAEPARGSTVDLKVSSDIAFDGLASHEIK